MKNKKVFITATYASNSKVIQMKKINEWKT
jgi:hypothetical protein